MAPSSLVFIGITGTVVALDRSTGSEVWRSDLDSDFVNVALQDGDLYATANGERHGAKGDESALQSLIPLVYRELRRLARYMSAEHVLQPGRSATSSVPVCRQMLTNAHICSRLNYPCSGDVVWNQMPVRSSS